MCLWVWLFYYTLFISLPSTTRNKVSKSKNKQSTITTTIYISFQSNVFGREKLLLCATTCNISGDEKYYGVVIAIAKRDPTARIREKTMKGESINCIHRYIALAKPIICCPCFSILLFHYTLPAQFLLSAIFCRCLDFHTK